MRSVVPILLLLLAARPAPASIHPLEDTGAWVKPSSCGKRLLKLLEHWPPPTAAIEDGKPEILRAIRTPGNRDLIGMVKHFEIQAPLSRVVEVQEEVERFPQMWDSVVSVQVQAREENRQVIEWTRERPAFFLPRIHYRLVSISDSSVPGRVVYRQQLIDGNFVKASDALIVYERVSESRTRATIVNFIDPEVGPFRAFAEGKIWRKTLENAFKDDIAFRARAEHPDWDLSRVTREAERALDRYPLDRIEYTDAIRLD